VLHERSRVARTTRVVLSAREMDRIHHARGVERLIRNDWWKGREQACFYDALEWLYRWTADKCLAMNLLCSCGRVPPFGRVDRRSENDN